tara:strand:- start:345 stop:776 length:432 start_codon:yes stop_codon:yes gene_type:complete
MRMEEKPKRRLLTKSTGQADLTGVKRPHRLAFCTSQQREVFSMQHDGSETIKEKLQPALKTLRELSDQHQGDPESLLLLLRDLEALHREIQDGAFRESLPEDRQKLFALLKTMERSGGWPYIPRLQLRTFIDLLEQDPADMAA